MALSLPLAATIQADRLAAAERRRMLRDLHQPPRRPRLRLAVPALQRLARRWIGLGATIGQAPSRRTTAGTVQP